MNIWNTLGNAFSGAVRGVQNIFAPKKPVAPQQAPQQPNIYDLGHFLQTHIGSAVNPANTVNNIAKIRIPGLGVNVGEVARQVPGAIVKTPGAIGNALTHPNEVGKGLYNVGAGLVVPTVVGAGEVYNRAINAPIQATLMAGGQALTGKPVKWQDNYNRAADKLTNSVTPGAQIVDKKLGTNVAGQVDSAYQHPKMTAAMTLLGGLLPEIGAAGVTGKIAESLIGAGMSAQAISQLPGQIQEIRKAPQSEQTRLWTELLANSALAIVGGAGAIHGGTAAVRELAPGAVKAVKAQNEIISSNRNARVEELTQMQAERSQMLQDKLASGMSPNDPAIKQLQASVTDLGKQIIAAKSGQGGYIRPGETVGKETPKTPQGQVNEVAPTEEIPKVTQRGFVQSVKNSPEVSANTADLVSGSYQTRSTQDLAKNAEKFAKSRGASTKISSELDVPLGNITDSHVANAIAVAKKLDAQGKFEQSGALYDKLAEHLTAQGQSIQAASLLSRRTPEGLLFGARKALNKAGVEITPEIKTALEIGIKAVRATEFGTPERDIAIQQFTHTVQQHIPSSVVDKLIGTWKAGMLTGVKTQSGNILSNTTFEALHKASNPLAAVLDYGLSLFTKERTKTMTLKGTASGALEGTVKGYKTLKTGIDPREATGSAPKFDQGELNFKNKAMETYVNGVFRLMNAADQPFFYSSLRNNLADLAKADGLTKGFKGEKLTAHIEEMMKNPTAKMLQTATEAAKKSTLGYDTFLSGLATRLRGASESVTNPIWRAGAKIALNVLAPFTKVPSAFLSRTIDFTPIGAIKEAVSQMGTGKFDQRALVTALSEATTGSGVIYLGAQLANHGLLSGDYPTDPREQQRWKANGIQPNSVHLGDKWYSMNYFGPVGILMSIGKHIQDAAATGASISEQASSAIAGLGKSLMGQSFLQGLNNAVSAVNDPGRYASNFVKSTAGSVVPTLINDFARAGDQFQRATNSVLDTVKSRIPGLRQTLPVSKDAFGNPLQRPSSAVDQLANPFRPSTDTHTPLTTELDRLAANGQSIFPTPDKTIQAGNTTYKLTPEQADTYNTAVGQQTQKAWNTFMADPKYATLQDSEKKQALQAVLDDIRSLEKVNALRAIGQTGPADELVKKLTQRQLNTDPANRSLADYLPKPKSAKPKQSKTVKTGRRTARVHVTKPPKFRTVKLAKMPSIKMSKMKSVKSSYAKVSRPKSLGKKLKLTA